MIRTWERLSGGQCSAGQPEEMDKAQRRPSVLRVIAYCKIYSAYTTPARAIQTPDTLTPGFRHAEIVWTEFRHA